MRGHVVVTARTWGVLSSAVVIPVHRFMPEALASLLRKAPLMPEKVAFAWRAAVGPAVDKATLVDLHGHVLRVRAKDAAWQCEVERSAGLIRARLDALLGEGVVARLDVTTGSRQDENTRASRRRRNRG